MEYSHTIVETGPIVDKDEEWDFGDEKTKAVTDNRPKDVTDTPRLWDGAENTILRDETGENLSKPDDDAELVSNLDNTNCDFDR